MAGELVLNPKRIRLGGGAGLIEPGDLLGAEVPAGGAHRWLRKRRGVRNETELVSGLDGFPTLGEYSGVAPAPGVGGASLRLARDGAGGNRLFVVSELADFGAPGREGRRLRIRRYQHVVLGGGDRPEQLFDLYHDPGEVLKE